MTKESRRILVTAVCSVCAAAASAQQPDVAALEEVMGVPAQSGEVALAQARVAVAADDETAVGS